MTFPHFIPGLLKARAGWTLCPEYEAVYNAYLTKPDDADAEVDNTMVLGWVDGGVWVKEDGIWVMANHAAGADSLMNWKDPTGTLAIAYNAPAYGQWEGWTGNGLDAYIDLNFNPFSDGVNYILNSASIGGYIRNNVAGNTYALGISDATNDHILLRPRSSTNTALAYINSQLWDADTNIDSRGMFVCNRADSTDQDIYKNKIKIVDGSDISTDVPNGNIYGLARNNNGVAAHFSPYQLSVIFAGSGLTQTDIDKITDRFETRMDYHGTGVIAA